MKRDARIGLAVVLVLGLAVTLLVGRALVKRGGDVAEAEPESGSGGTASYSAEATRVEGAPTANIASANPASAAPTIEGAEPAARRAEEANPAIQRFVEDQTKRLGVEAAAPSPANPTPATGNKAPTVEAPVKATAGSVTAPDVSPKADHSLLLDHEQAGPTPAADTQQPADGYGYTIAAGDNMWKISSKVYGDGKFTQKIIEANPGLSASKMKVGSVIKIPSISNKTVLMKLPTFAEASKAPAGGSAVALKEKETKKEKASEPVAASTHAKAPEPDAAGGEATTHKVESGETLAVIAHKYYGVSGPKTIAKIVAANKGLDPAKLKVGQELQIPAKK